MKDLFPHYVKPQVLHSTLIMLISYKPIIQFEYSFILKTQLTLVVFIQAVGEPPLFLSASIFFAIKDAISSARTDAGLSGTFRLDSPASSERIRMACQDQFTMKVSIRTDCFSKRLHSTLYQTFQ